MITVCMYVNSWQARRGGIEENEMAVCRETAAYIRRIYFPSEEKVWRCGQPKICLGVAGLTLTGNSSSAKTPIIESFRKVRHEPVQQLETLKRRESVSAER
jgi:hypothetical protein